MTRRALALACLLAACEPSEGPRAEPPAAERDVPRRALGQTPAHCEGTSDDPADLDRMASGAGEDLESAIAAMEAIVGGHAGSATARVRLGELLLRAAPPRAEVAGRWFARALALHDDGCVLATRDHWAALEGAAVSEMIAGDYAAALPFLRGSLERWPAVRSTRYNLACALCKTGELSACERELRTVLAAEGDPPPAFLRTEAPAPGHYERRIRQDPDLVGLREDPDRLARLLGR